MIISYIAPSSINTHFRIVDDISPTNYDDYDYSILNTAGTVLFKRSRYSSSMNIIPLIDWKLSSFIFLYCM